jgi:hypothetical protein
MRVIKGLIVIKWEDHQTVPNNLGCGFKSFSEG